MKQYRVLTGIDVVNFNDDNGQITYVYIHTTTMRSQEWLHLSYSYESNPLLLFNVCNKCRCIYTHLNHVRHIVFKPHTITKTRMFM